MQKGKGKPSSPGRKSVYGGGKQTGGSVYGAIPTPRGTSQSVYRGTGGGAVKQPPSDGDFALAKEYLSSRSFKILEKLGEGNYAMVVRVRGIDNRDMAVKIIDLKKCSSNYKNNFFPKELEVMQKLRHKYFTEIYEIQKLNDTVFIFMEYVMGGTIADFIQKHKAIPEFMAKPIIMACTEALFYMHDKNMAHRDLKVENILLDKSMNPKITDFSYSTPLKLDEKKQVIKTKTFCGSLPYIAPEILHEKEYDPRQTDVWSFGVCIFVMLNNNIPFKFDDLQGMKKKMMAKQYTFRSSVEVSAECKDAVAQMLEPDENKRIKMVQLMTHPWFLKK